jgi:hypothetical protein
MDLIDSVESAKHLAWLWNNGQFKTLQGELNTAVLELARIRRGRLGMEQTLEDLESVFDEASLRELLRDVVSGEEKMVFIHRAAAFAAEKLGTENHQSMDRLSRNKGESC